MQMGSSANIEALYAQGIALRNSWAADPSHRRRLDFPEEVARAMVVGRELFKRVNNPDAVRVRSIESIPTRHAFIVLEEDPRSRDPLNLHTDLGKRIREEILLTMADPTYTPMLPRKILDSTLGFDTLAHWILRTEELTIDQRQYALFEPYLFVLKPELRGMSVGSDSLKRLEAGARRLKFDLAMWQGNERNMALALRLGFGPFESFHPELRAQIAEKYFIINPQVTAIKPFNSRLQRYSFSR